MIIRITLSAPSTIVVDETTRIRLIIEYSLTSWETSAVSWTRESAYNFDASSIKDLYNSSRLFSLCASCCALACVCWVNHEVAKDVRPPISAPPNAAKAEIVAASIIDPSSTYCVRYCGGLALKTLSICDFFNDSFH